MLASGMEDYFLHTGIGEIKMAWEQYEMFHGPKGTIIQVVRKDYYWDVRTGSHVSCELFETGIVWMPGEPTFSIAFHFGPTEPIKNVSEAISFLENAQIEISEIEF